MKVKYVVYAVMLIGLGVLVSYRIISNKNQGGKTGKMPAGTGTAMRVDGVVVQPVRFANALSVSGTIDANEQVSLRSQVSGTVVGLYFEEGSAVRKGQPLLQIDNAELKAQLAQARTRQELSARNEERARRLLGTEAISQQDYDIALADFKALQSQTQLINAQLAKTTIRAPFAGTIGLRSISVGEFLSPETVIARLVNTHPLKITFSVPEKYAAQTKTGTKLTFTVSGSEKKHAATVYAIEPSIEAATRTVQLRARAENPDGELRPGAFANVELPVSTIENALFVPTEAIVPVQNGKKVFVARNGKATEVKVETSTRRQKDILVTAGLQAGDTVLTTGVMSLKAETPVNVTVVGKQPVR